MHDQHYDEAVSNSCFSQYATFDALVGPTGRASSEPQQQWLPLPKSHRFALQRGWSIKEGPTAGHAALRSGAPWNGAEDRDLLAAARHSLDLGRIAVAHGRSETAITCRLELLGYDKTALIAMDFADVELRAISTLIADKHEGNTTMKMTANRLILLLAAHRGSLGSELRTGTTAPDLAFLTIEGLLEQTGHGQHDITPYGRELVRGLLTGTSTSAPTKHVGGTNTAWSNGRNTSVLGDQRFFLVASGDCMKGGPRGRAQLKKPPTTVQSSQADAEREAKRLADVSRGEKFFVLQATSVHEVAPTPARSRSL